MSTTFLLLLEIFIIIVVGLALYSFARRGIRRLEKRDYLSLQSSAILTGAIKWAFIIAVVLSCFTLMGISVTTLWASLSAVLMLIALGFVAVWSILSNASCALFLVLFQPFRIGDDIEIIEPSVVDPTKPGLRGRVIKISFVYTTVCETTADGEQFQVHVPNNQLFQKAIRCRRGENTTSLKSALFQKKTAEPVDPGLATVAPGVGDDNGVTDAAATEEQRP